MMPNSNEHLQTAACERYYFENQLEFLAYVSTYNGNKNVVWAKGNAYFDEYQKGYQLFEENNFSEAIAVFRHCLTLNPVGLSARFEICEAYLHLHNLAAAKETLLDMKNFLVDKKNQARFYRRMGYIETERKNYLCAAACHAKSVQIDPSALTFNETTFITQQIGKRKFRKALRKTDAILRKNQIPILPIEKATEKQASKKMEGAKWYIAAISLLSICVVGLGIWVGIQIDITQNWREQYRASLKTLPESTLSEYKFYNQHAVIVPDDGTHTYHRYSCPRLDTASGVWIFNTEAAKSEGYKPCSRCQSQ